MAPRKQEENERIREERKEKILRAAGKVFARSGLTATKIADIAGAAEMSHGLIYHYFASKEEIFRVLVERAIQGSIYVTQGAKMQPGTPWDQIRWMAAMMLGGVQRSPEYFMLVFQAFTNGSVVPEARDIASRGAQITGRALIALIQEGQAAGQVVQGDPEQLSLIFTSAIQGLAITLLFTSEQFPIPEPDLDHLLRILKA